MLPKNRSHYPRSETPTNNIRTPFSYQAHWQNSGSPALLLTGQQYTVISSAAESLCRRTASTAGTIGCLNPTTIRQNPQFSLRRNTTSRVGSIYLPGSAQFRFHLWRTAAGAVKNSAG